MGRRRGRRNRRGAGWLGDAWNGIKRGVSKAHDWIKDHHVVSIALGATGHPILGGIARIAGYGRGMKGKRMRCGGGTATYGTKFFLHRPMVPISRVQ